MIRKIKTKKLLLFLFAVILSSAKLLNAQDYAGPDKHICAGSSAQIGSSGIPGACYAWTPETGLSDPHIANPIATPISTTTYTVKVVGVNFSFTASDQATVIIDNLESFTANPTRCCWNKGDILELKDFKITTSPPGMESNLSNFIFDPIEAPSSPWPFIREYDATINLIATNTCVPNSSLQTTVSIHVIDPDKTTTITPVEVSWFSLIDFIKNYDEVLEKFSKLGVCNFSWGLSQISTGLTGSFGKRCCFDDNLCIVKEIEKLNGYIKYTPSIECNFPTGASIPYIGGINWYLTAGLNVTANFNNNPNCTESKFTVIIIGSIYGGAGVSILLGPSGNPMAFLRGYFYVEGSIPVIIYEHPPSAWNKSGPFCLNLELRGELKWICGLKQRISWTVYKGCW